MGRVPVSIIRLKNCHILTSLLKTERHHIFTLKYQWPHQDIPEILLLELECSKNTSQFALTFIKQTTNPELRTLKLY